MAEITDATFQQAILLSRQHLVELVGTPITRGVDVPAMTAELDHSLPSGGARDCLHAGLWVLAGDLERAHSICQEVPSAYGSAWHAVVHRREGDFWNSKYWWRRASGIDWADLAQRIRGEAAVTLCAGGKYDPAAFVDLVEQLHRTAARDALVAVQRLEWEALFRATWIAAR